MMRASRLLPLLITALACGATVPAFAQPAINGGSNSNKQAPAKAGSAKSAPAKKEIQALYNAFNLQKKQLQAQETLLKSQRDALDRQQQALEQQKQQLEQLQRQMAALSGVKSPVVAAEPVKAEKVAPGGSQVASKDAKPEEVGVDRKPVTPEKPPEIAATIDEGGVLLPKGRLLITPSTEYSRSSATRVAIQGFSIIPALNIGLFQISQVDRDTFTEAVSARLGLTNRIEVDAKIPYLYRNDATRSRPVGAGSSTDTLTQVDGYGIGDIEVGAHYQFDHWEKWPYFVGNLRVKADTGTSPFEIPLDSNGVATELATGSGFYAVQPSITAIYPTDPVVFYSNIGYLHNFKKNFGGTVGEIEPGDSISSSFGMSLALNDRSSISVGYGHSTVFETKQNGARVPNSTYLQVGTIDVGYAYTLTDQVSVNVNVSAGVTEDAPDSRITFRVPIAFDLY